MNSCGYTGGGVTVDIDYGTYQPSGVKYLVGNLRSWDGFDIDLPDVERPPLLEQAGWQQQYCAPNREMHERLTFNLELNYDDQPTVPIKAGWERLYGLRGLTGLISIVWPALTDTSGVLLDPITLSGVGWITALNLGDHDLQNDEIVEAGIEWRFQGGDPADVSGFLPDGGTRTAYAWSRPEA